MPEGDTIHRTAKTLALAIQGQQVRRFQSVLPELEDVRDLEGLRVERVEARGKHLLIRFEDGRTLHTHMMMDGSWHLAKPRERWRVPRSRAVAVIETDPWIAICIDAPICELVPAGVEPEMVKKLGPDLLDPDADLAEAERRLRALGELPIGVALMKQTAVAGIGNVYKSEVLFIGRVSPFTPVAELSYDSLRALVGEARVQLQRNVTLRARQTRRRFGQERHWVYDRSGRPCFECGTTIRMRRQGALRRSTYFCPTCQRTTDGGAAVDSDRAPR